MSEVTERSIFPGDEFQPLSFGKPQLLFLLKHVGKTPRGAGFVVDGQTGEWTHPDLPVPVWCQETRVAMQRLYEETHRDDWDKENNEKMLDKIRQHIMAALEYSKRKSLQTKQFGEVDYNSIGVGLGDGQTRYENFFRLQLAYKHVPMKKNWVQGIIDSLAGGFDPLKADQMLETAIDELADAHEQAAEDAIAEVFEEQEAPEVSYKCFVCDWKPKDGSQRPKVALGNHVRMAHPERLADFELMDSMTVEQPAEPSPPPAGDALEEVLNA